MVEFLLELFFDFDVIVSFGMLWNMLGDICGDGKMVIEFVFIFGILVKSVCNLVL